MSSLTSRTRRFSGQCSPPPSPTMQALRIGSLHRSPGSDGAYTRPPHPAYVAGKPAAANTHLGGDLLNLDDDLDDDFEPEPALTSDDATAPSSSRAPSPSLSPVDDAAFVAVVSSSPQRDSFLRSYIRPSATVAKPDPCDEDVAAVLLSLSLPRVGRLPLASALPQRPISPPNSPTPQIVPKADAVFLTSHHKIVPGASRQSMPSRTTTVEDRLSQPALIDVPSPVLPAKALRRSRSPLVQSDETQKELVQEDNASPAPLSLLQLSPLPPSSPLPEEDDENAADTDEDARLSLSRMSSPLSCLSSIPSSPKMTLESLDADLDLPELDLSTRDLSPSPEPIVMSPLSSPPTSRASSLAPASVEKPRFSRQTQSDEGNETEDTRPEPSKRKSSTPPPESPPRRKRARRIIPESSPEPDSEAEAAIQADSAVDSERDTHMREPTPEPAPRRKRTKAAYAEKKAARSVNTAKGKVEKADAIVPVGDRTNESCPHPALPSLVVEAFALSRATSLSSIALYDVICASYPAMAGSVTSSTRAGSTAKPGSPVLSQQDVEEVLLWGAAREIFELLPSSGDGLPPTFFYLPAADWDTERAGLHAALGGRVARAGRRAYKQYYWKPVVLPRGGGGRSSRKRGVEEEVQRGWEVDWEE